ncbi:MAG TPA: hypothetical protein VJ483_01275 [Holophagaceae bacterium]|nr:hypothetical protein [Holophagaceae bacterium]
MGVLGFGGGEGGRSPSSERLNVLEVRAQAELQGLEALRAQVRERDEDRRLLLDASRILKPGAGPKALGQALFDLCHQPFDLYTFYVALADYESDLLSFPYYYEGGKARNLSPDRLSTFNGLTTKAMAAKESRYYASLEDQTAVGVVFTEAERITGLIPQSWYGVPLACGPGWADRACGLVSFQSFEKGAFSESRRDIMDALGALLSLALKAEPALRLDMTET